MVIAAIVLWTIAITLALTHMLELSVFSAWLVGLSLTVSMGIAVFLIIYEMRHAIDLPADDLELPETDGIGASVFFGSPLLAGTDGFGASGGKFF